MYTFFKFFCVGVLNTALDFLVLNICIILFGEGPRGGLFVIFKSISFLAAVINSFFLNKYWVFEHTKTKDIKEPIIFFVVSVGGYLINVSISFVVFVIFVHEISPHLAANVGALMGTFAVFAWNFIGYRFFVFNKQSHD